MVPFVRSGMDRSTNEPVKWFWAPPLKQPIIKRRGLVRACVATAPLDLADVCCRCGKPKAKLRSLRVVEASKAGAVLKGAEMLGGPMIAGIRLLTQTKVMVPCCSACNSLHRWGMVAGVGIILVGIGTFVGFASMDRDAKLRLPTW